MNTRLPLPTLTLLSVLLALLAAGCAVGASQPVIQLSRLEPLPDPPAPTVAPLRVAVAAIISPQGTVDSYGPLLDELGRQLGRPVELVQRRTYAEVNDLVKTGGVDLAFVCTNAYVLGSQTFGMALLAAPQVGGATTYHSLLIVPAGSPAQHMADLQGKVFAFTDPLSTTGHNYPVYLVQQLGSTPAQFFQRTFFTYSHDDAIRAVAAGVADGAAVDSLVYDFAVRRDPTLAEKVRVIHRSPPFGIPPVVVGPHVRPQQRARLQEALFALSHTETGRAALENAGIDAFVPINPTAYTSVRQLMEAVGQIDHQP